MNKPSPNWTDRCAGSFRHQCGVPLDTSQGWLRPRNREDTNRDFLAQPADTREPLLIAKMAAEVPFRNSFLAAPDVGRVFVYLANDFVSSAALRNGKNDFKER